MKKLVVAAVSVFGFLVSPASPARAAALEGTWGFVNTCNVDGVLYRHTGTNNNAFTDENFNCAEVKVSMRWFDVNDSTWKSSTPGWTANSFTQITKLTTAYPDYSQHYGRHIAGSGEGVGLLNCTNNCDG
jgi:hypothetical protein